MKKLLYTLLAVSIIFSACEKEEEETSNTGNNNISTMFADIKGDWEGDITCSSNTTINVLGDWYANISSDGPNLIIDGYFMFDLTGETVGFSGDIDDGGGYPWINATTQSGGYFSGEIDIEGSNGSGTWSHLPTIDGIWVGIKSK